MASVSVTQTDEASLFVQKGDASKESWHWRVPEMDACLSFLRGERIFLGCDVSEKWAASMTVFVFHSVEAKNSTVDAQIGRAHV